MANNTYTAAGANTWTCPVGVTTANIETWGGGGGGSNRGANGVGGGGGGGAYAKLTDFAVSANQVYNLVVGAAGSRSGGAGGNSSFNNAANTIVCQAEGGRGPGSANETGAAGGAIANSTGNVTYDGGAGASGVASTYGGGGGGSGGTGANGNPGSTYNGAGAVTGGGPGGNGRNTANGIGVAPVSGPGGGGGGCWKNSTTARLGGYGYNGQVVITYADVTSANDTVHATLADIVTVVVSKPIVLSASNNIAAGGNTATTAQLTAPANKTSGNNFVAGKISDDTNPLPSIDVSANNYTEVEFCIKADSTKGAANNQVYNLRLTANGTAFNNYTANAAWTIGVGGGATEINANNTVHATLADAGVLLQTHLIAANDAVHTAPTDAAVVLQTHVIVSADTVHATLADQATAIATSVIVSADGTHATLADGATLLQTQIVGPADCVHVQPCDDATISVTGGVTITAADCVHAQPADATAVLQTHLLTAADTVHVDNFCLPPYCDSKDFTTWQTYGTPVLAQDQVGYDLAPNKAWTLTDNQDDWAARIDGPISGIADDPVNTAYTASVLVKKDNDESRFPTLYMGIYQTPTSQQGLVKFNTKTGATAPVSAATGGGSYGVESYDGTWWRVWITLNIGGTDPDRSIYISIEPASSTTWAGYEEDSATGSIIIDQAQLVHGSLPGFATFEQINILIAEESIHLQTLDIASILQTHLITADDNAHAQFADEASFSLPPVEITPGACVHGGIVPEIIMSSKGKFLKKATSAFYVEL
jgi:hypothetical protein